MSGEAEFYAELARLTKEREEAYEVRKEDPDRWKKAKHAYAEFRDGLRAFREAEDAQRLAAAEGDSTVRPDPVAGGVVVNNPAGGN